MYPNPNSEPVLPVKITSDVVTPTLIAGELGALGACAGPNFTQDDGVVLVPQTVATWLVRVGKGVLA